jgi:hypothetical protein
VVSAGAAGVVVVSAGAIGVVVVSAGAIGVVVVSAGAGSVSAGAGVVTVGVLFTSTVEVDGCEFAEKTRYAMASSAKATMMPTNQPVELFSRV